MRTYFKIPLFFLFTTIFCLSYLVCLLVVKLFRFRFEPLRNAAMAFWSKGSALILNMKIETVGKPPKPPFILVLNHLSYLDILPVFINSKCTFVAKKEVRSWPLLGYMIKMMGVIFVDRSRKRDVVRVNKLLMQNLNEKQGIVLFPEGTSSGGKEVLPFRSPLLEFPASEKLPVHVASLKYETTTDDEPAEESVCFYGARHSFPQHLFKMGRNKKIFCTIRFGEHPITNSNRKELADELRTEVFKIFEPTDSRRTPDK